MPTLLQVPGVAADTTDVTLLSWALPENTPFAASDVVAIVETAKAVVEVEAEAAGVLVRQLVAEGTDVSVGAPIALLAAPGETVHDVDASLRELGFGSVDAAPIKPAPLEPAHRTPLPPASTRHRIFASPLARRLARDSRLPIDQIEGTGPNGRILRRDVDTALSQRSVARVPSVDRTEPAGWVDIPHTRMRRAIAARLTESKSTVPHFYVRGTAQVDALLALRTDLNRGEPEVKVSLNDLIVMAVARAHSRVPALNVNWTPDAIRQLASVDVGVAIASARGLFTPVVRGVNQLGVRALSTAIRDLAARAAEGRLAQHELEGGSVAVSNLGMFGTEEFAGIINPPHACLLAVGAVLEAPVVRQGLVEVGHILRVCLAVDHRPVDGADAARWMQTFIGLLETPIQIVA